MAEEKKKPFEELDFGQGLVCDAETGICEIPGATREKAAEKPPVADQANKEKGDS